MLGKPTPMVAALAAGTALLIACDNAAPPVDLDQFTMGPAIDSGLLGDDRLVNSHEQERLAQSLPPELTPLHSHLPLLYVAESLTPVAIDASHSPVDVSWSVPPTSYVGFYLRIRPRPFGPDVCPAAGTSLAAGAAALDGIDAFPHPLRRYREGSRLAAWDVAAPPLTLYQHYYLQGCVVARATGTFTGEETNTVEVEFVRALPDLHPHVVRVYASPPHKGQVFLWIQDRQARSDVRGDRVDYEIQITRAASGYDETFAGDTTLNFGPGAVVTSGPGFVVPDDGNWYDIDVRVNPNRRFPESDYANNDHRLTQRVSIKPAVLVVDRIEVHQNCDDRSPGDWQGIFRVDVESDVRRQWRVATNYFDVDETTYPRSGRGGFFAFGLADVPLDATVDIILAFEDCDVLTAGCGEEWVEHPFGRLLGAVDDQHTGEARATLTLEHRRTGAVVTADASGGRCGDRPFTALYRLLEPAEASAAGYAVRCGLDDTNTFADTGPPTFCR